MKKAFYILMAFVAISCTGNLPEKNACQFVRENAGLYADNIKDVEVVGKDSVILLLFEHAMVATRSADFRELASTGEFGGKDVSAYKAFLDSMMQKYSDAVQSWEGSYLVADSVRHKYGWRQVYTVKVTMRSGSTKTTRVLMDSDRTTPRLLLRDAIEELNSMGTSLTKGYDDVSWAYDYLECRQRF